MSAARQILRAARHCFALSACASALFQAHPVAADVVILANRSPAAVKFSAALGSAPGKAYQLASGDLVPLPCPPDTEIRVAFLSAGERHDYSLRPNSIYYFHSPQNSQKLDLEQISVTGQAENEPAPTAKGQVARSASRAPAPRPRRPRAPRPKTPPQPPSSPP